MRDDHRGIGVALGHVDLHIQRRGQRPLLRRCDVGVAAVELDRGRERRQVDLDRVGRDAGVDALRIEIHIAGVAKRTGGIAIDRHGKRADEGAAGRQRCTRPGHDIDAGARGRCRHIGSRRIADAVIHHLRRGRERGRARERGVRRDRIAHHHVTAGRTVHGDRHRIRSAGAAVLSAQSIGDRSAGYGRVGRGALGERDRRAIHQRDGIGVIRRCALGAALRRQLELRRLAGLRRCRHTAHDQQILQRAGSDRHCTAAHDHQLARIGDAVAIGICDDAEPRRCEAAARRAQRQHVHRRDVAGVGELMCKGKRIGRRTAHALTAGERQRFQRLHQGAHGI